MYNRCCDILFFTRLKLLQVDTFANANSKKQKSKQTNKQTHQHKQVNKQTNKQTYNTLGAFDVFNIYVSINSFVLFCFVLFFVSSFCFLLLVFVFVPFVFGHFISHLTSACQIDSHAAPQEQKQFIDFIFYSLLLFCSEIMIIYQ